MAKRGANVGSIYKRKDGRWAASIHLGYEGGSRRRKTYYGKTRREVQAKLTAALRAHQQGLPIASARQTVGQFLVRWLEDSARPSLRPLTFVTYESIVRLHLQPALGRIQLDRLTPQHVQALLNERSAAGLAPATVRNIQRVLHRALEVAARWGLVGRNVARLVDVPRRVRKDVRVLSPEEARALLDAVKGDRLEALYTVALATGLRQGEALGLRWSDVVLDASMLTVRGALARIEGELRIVEPKSATSRRSITLPEFAVSSLRDHRARQLQERLRAGEAWHPEWNLVFATPQGAPLDARRVRTLFKAHLAHAGLPDVRFHDLRHSCASLLLAQGVPARVVMETLGHSSISMTMDIYSHVFPALSREAAHSMDAALAGGG